MVTCDGVYGGPVPATVAAPAGFRGRPGYVLATMSATPTAPTVEGMVPTLHTHTRRAALRRLAISAAALSLAACSGTPATTPTTGGETTTSLSSTSAPETATSGTSTTAAETTTTTATPTGEPSGSEAEIEPRRTAFVSSVRVTVAKVRWDATSRSLEVSGTLTNLGPLDGSLGEILGRSPVAVEVGGALVELSHPVPKVPVGSTTSFQWGGSLATAPGDLAAGALVVGSNDGSRVRVPFGGAYTTPAGPVAHLGRGTVVATKAVRLTVVDSLVRPTYAVGEPPGTLVDLRVAGLGLVDQYGGYRLNDEYLNLVDARGNAVVGDSTAGAPDFINVLGLKKQVYGWVTFRVDAWRPPYTLKMTLPDFSPPQTASKPVRLR